MCYQDIDCEECDNYEDVDTCYDCEHNPNLFCRFEDIDPVKKAERAARHKKQFIASVPKAEVFITPTPEFMKKLKLAWKFAMKAEREGEKLFCVYCGKGYLLATDTFRMARIDADCPKEIIGKHIILDDVEDKLYSKPDDHTSVLSNGQAQVIIDNVIGWEIKGLKSTMPFEDCQVERSKWTKEDHSHVSFNNVCKLNKAYVEDVLDAIPDDEEITIVYKGKEDAIRIKALGIDALILPIRE